MAIDLQLRDLKYFETVATLGDVAQAAVVLGSTQPALTRSIQRLEHAFGSPLFERAGQGNQLTPVGEVLLARARRLRASADEALREVSDFAHGHSGHVRIGSGPTPADDVLPQICALLLGQLKTVTLQITLASSAALAGQLRDAQIDLLVGLRPEAADDEFMFHPIVEDVVVVAASASHPVFDLPKPSLGSLLGYSWVLPSPQLPSRDWLDAVFAQSGLLKPRVQVETDAIALLPRLVARTHLLGFVSRHAMGRGRKRGLREVALPETTLTRILGVSHRREGALAPAAKRLLELLQVRGPAIYAQFK